MNCLVARHLQQWTLGFKIIALSSSISLFAVKLETDGGRRLIGEFMAYREGRA